MIWSPLWNSFYDFMITCAASLELNKTLQWRHNGHDGVSNHQPHSSGAYQRKHQSSASLAFVRGNHLRPVNSLHKWPVTRKMFPFDDVNMTKYVIKNNNIRYPNGMKGIVLDYNISLRGLINLIVNVCTLVLTSSYRRSLSTFYC